MAIRHANAELAARAYLKSIPELPTNQIGTTLPQKLDTWSSTGFVQFIVTGAGRSSKYYGYRAPVITAHFWATNPYKQNPPWGKACDLGEIVYAELVKDDNGRENLSLGVEGAPNVRVLEAWPVTELKRIPWGFPSGQGSFIDPANTAHYTLDFSIAWAELP